MPHVDYIGSDGKPWPSATELTQLLPQEWILAWYKQAVKKSGWRGWQRCLAQSKRGMAIGSIVHEMIEGYITKAPAVPHDSKYGSDRIADALFDKVNPLVKEWLAIEPHLQSEELKLHGTADAIVYIKIGEDNYQAVILDWKTSAKESMTHPIQLAIYALCWNEMHPEEPISRGIIARVDKKSKRLTVKLDEYPNLDQYYPVIKALRTVWEYVKNEG